MRRRLVVLLTTAVVLVAAPASAKPGEIGPPRAIVTISGPGLESPIVWGDDAAWKLLYVTTFHAYGVQAPEPPTVLGPSYRASYAFVSEDGTVTSFEQTLYPCAETDAVWAYTPNDDADVRQRFGQPVTSGWQRSAAMYPTLRESGLPPCRDLVGSAASAPSGSGGSSRSGPLVGLAIVAALALAGAFGQRRDRQVVAGR